MILQKGTRPVFIAQMNKDWDMIQLLDERYGCSIEVALHQVGYTQQSTNIYILPK